MLAKEVSAVNGARDGKEYKSELAVSALAKGNELGGASRLRE